MDGEITKETPILFSGPMVRAILEGRKTQTRRVITCANSYVDGGPEPKKLWDDFDLDRAWVDPGPSPAGNEGPYLKAPRPMYWDEAARAGGKATDESVHRIYPRVWKGDRFWVKETFDGTKLGNGSTLVSYRASGDKPVTDYGKWRPSIFMPRWASRIDLAVENVRPERLQDITQKDSLAEGINYPRYYNSPSSGPVKTENPPSFFFQKLWDSINAKRGLPWELNPWVWVYTFRVVEGGENATHQNPVV
jgi:hypothetical protein